MVTKKKGSKSKIKVKPKTLKKERVRRSVPMKWVFSATEARLENYFKKLLRAEGYKVESQVSVSKYGSRKQIDLKFTKNNRTLWGEVKALKAGNKGIEGAIGQILVYQTLLSRKKIYLCISCHSFVSLDPLIEKALISNEINILVARNDRLFWIHDIERAKKVCYHCPGITGGCQTYDQYIRNK